MISRLSRPWRAALVVGAVVGAATACVPTPDVTAAPPGNPPGSIAGQSGPRGYTESEFFLSGAANRYQAVGDWGRDGIWRKEVTAREPYSTRVLVDRPADAAKFNGTVWVEWLNVSGGVDAAASFSQARDHILASGAAWVGVSAQKGGLDATKSADPTRYGSLSIASDALSYDIYSQAGKAVRTHADQLLGGLVPERVIAAGESQSAFRLTTYINAWHNDDRVYDGFLVHSRFSFAAPLDTGFAGTPSARIRADVANPVLQLETESDLGGWEAVRRPDAGNLHTWEVAGAAHADVYTLATVLNDPTVTGAGVAWLLGCAKPVNSFPFHYAANAGYAALERWVTDGTRPASTTPIEIVNDVIQRDADGNAKGGLRLPDIDVPVATHTGTDNAAAAGGNFFCSLFGNTTPFTPAQLAQRYPTHVAYVADYTAKADAALAARIMTKADRDAAVAAAQAAPIPS